MDKADELLEFLSDLVLVTAQDGSKWWVKPDMVDAYSQLEHEFVDAADLKDGMRDYYKLYALTHRAKL